MIDDMLNSDKRILTIADSTENTDSLPIIASQYHTHAFITTRPEIRDAIEDQFKDGIYDISSNTSALSRKGVATVKANPIYNQIENEFRPLVYKNNSKSKKGMTYLVSEFMDFAQGLMMLRCCLVEFVKKADNRYTIYYIFKMDKKDLVYVCFAFDTEIKKEIESIKKSEKRNNRIIIRDIKDIQDLYDKKCTLLGYAYSLCECYP
jgi:hypothetical protein